MRKNNIVPILSLFIVIMSNPVYAITMYLDPSPLTVNSGQIFSLDLNVSDLDTSTDLIAAFQVDLLYDSNLFEFASVTFGSSLGDPIFDALTYFDNSIPGDLYLDEMSFIMDDNYLAFLQSDTFTLATIQFTTLGMGDATFDLSGAVLSHSWGYDLPTTTEGANVSATAPIPEPDTFFLIGIGLIGVAGAKRRKKIIDA